MPSKFVVRNFAENSYYHVYNRGIENKDIFLDEKDYRFFEIYLFIYLHPLKEVLEKYPYLPTRLHGKNLSEKVKLAAYCLMPNHFHLLLKQETKDGISQLMKQITNAYTLYFNQKNKRVGGLMQGRFKAAPVTENHLLTHLTRYIHLNPVISNLAQDPATYLWSSYHNYLGKATELSCFKEDILSHFSTPEDFQNFHAVQPDYSKELEIIRHLIIEKN